jgi:raffinose/stachyose/melibiose transport system permease protein
MRLAGPAQRRQQPGTSPDQAVASRPAPGRKSTRPGAGRHLRRRLEIALFVSPALLLYLVFVLLPIVLAAYYSVFHWNGLDPLNDFVGLDNYRRAFGDEAFRKAITHNGILVVLSLVIQGPLALGVALLLNRRMRGRAGLRAVIFAPYVLSEAITAVIWLLMLQPDGLVDKALQAAGLGSLVHLWLADVRLVFYTMFVVITWKYVGFSVILFLAGLQGIPPELHEAAAIDGAGELRTIRHVTIPLLGPTLRIWAFLTIIGSLQLFDLVWIMTLGGPANASNTMATYMIDRGFVRYQLGYGSAVAVILFAISLVFAILYQRYVLRRDIEGAVTRAVG